jgi:hypothetical protein
MPKPATYDRKPKTPFRPWWKSIIHYFRYYPETRDEPQIAFVGALLTDKAKECHFASDDLISIDQGGRDNWVAYSEAIVNEYTHPREGAAAHDTLKALKYKGDIKAYLTGFTTLNRPAGSNGEGLQDIVNKALLDEIIDVRFYQNPRALNTDQDFLTATNEAGRYVETLKALKARKTAKAGPPPATQPKDGQSSGKTGKAVNSQEEQKGSKQVERPDSGSKTERSGNRWESLEEALRGVPENEKEDHKTLSGACFRCGKEGHRA